MKVIRVSLLLLLCFSIYQCNSSKNVPPTGKVEIAEAPEILESEKEALKNTAPSQGYTKDKLSVSSMGLASFQYPVSIPPGTKGMHPSLSLGYQSIGRNGYLGVGWGLHGLSSISRCLPLMDPEKTPPALGQYDYCLDGVRLIKASDGNYHTEKESWQKIVPNFDGGSSSDPSSFTIYTKSGYIKTFGGATNSQVFNKGTQDIRTWAISKESDRNGNYINYNYINTSSQTGEFYPDSIEYTGNDIAAVKLIPQRKISFSYEDRSDPISHYDYGSEILIQKRMKSLTTSIQINGKFETVLTVGLNYNYSPSTKRSRLISVSETGADGTTFKPLNYTWQNTPLSMGGSKQISNFSHANTSCSWGNFNGDGLPDLLCSMSKSPFVHWAFYGSTNGVLDGPHELIKAGSENTSYSWRDFNADGLVDLILDEKVPGQSANNHKVYLSKGKSLSSPLVLRTFGSSDCTFLWIDFNGDGRSDLACSEDKTSHQQWVALSNGQNIETPIFLGTLGQGIGISQWADVNGDGRSDLVFDQTESPFQHWVRFSEGNKLSNEVFLGQMIPRTSEKPTYTWVDFNGDGKTDLIMDDILDASNSFAHSVRLSNGKTLEPIINLDNYGKPGSKYTWQDFNNDGKADLLIAQKIEKGGAHIVKLSTGTSLLPSPINLGVGGSEDSVSLWTDLNGDGLLDVTMIGLKTGSSQWLKQSGDYPDLVNERVNGSGGSIRLTYKPLTDTAIYSKKSFFKYPNRSTQPTTHVVTEQVSSDGREYPKLYNYTYKYKNAHENVIRKDGFQFEQVIAVDRNSLNQTVTTYETDFPLRGVEAEQLIQTVDGVNLNHSTHAYAVEQPIPGVYVVNKNQETLFHLDSGTESYGLTKNYNYDNYGNLVMVKVSSGASTKIPDLYSCTTYLNDIANWRLGRPTDTIQTNSASFNKTKRTCQHGLVLTHKKMAYDEKDNIISRSSWDGKNWMTTTNKYDDYGNSIESIDKSRGKVTTTYESVYHTFPQTVTNALNYVHSVTYDPRFGIQTQTTDVNGNKNKIILDGFGRIVQKWGPATNGSKEPINQLIQISREYKAAGTALDFQVSSYFRRDAAESDYSKWAKNLRHLDGLGRVWRIEKSRFDLTNPIYVDTEFDNQARPANHSVPYYKNEAPAWVSMQYDFHGRVKNIKHPKSYSEVIDRLIVNDPELGVINRTRKLNGAGSTPEFQKEAYRGANSQIYREVYPKEADQSIAPTINFAYDELSRLREIDQPGGMIQKIVLDPLGKALKHENNYLGNVSFTYDPDTGLMTSQTDARGFTSTFEYDALGRVVRKKEGPRETRIYFDNAQKNPNVKNGLLKTTKVEIYEDSKLHYVKEMSYDNYGNQSDLWITITDKGTYHQNIVYDLRGKTQQVTYPNGAILKNKYNGYGFLTEVSVAKDATSSFIPYATYSNFTANGKHQKVVYKNGVVSELNYNDSSLIENLKITPKGATKPNVDQTYQYTPLRRISGIIDNIDSTKSQSFTYNLSGYLTKAVSVGEYGTLNYAYDSAGNITLKDGTTFSYTGAFLTKGVKAGQTVFTIGYDKAGNMTSKNIGQKKWTYAYDEGGRLTSVSEGGVVVSTFDYAMANNRFLKSDIKNKTETYYITNVYEKTYLDGGTSYQDTYYIPGVNGVITAITSAKTAVKSGAIGSISLQGAGGYSIFSSANIIFIFLALLLGLFGFKSRRPIRSLWFLLISFTVFFNSFTSISALAAEKPNLVMEKPLERGVASDPEAGGIPVEGEIFFHQDQVTSTKLVTDSSGEIQSRLVYKPYGELFSLEGKDDLRVKFSGHELDESAELYYMGARYYDASLGRFITADNYSKGGREISAAAYNRYAYAGNNPISFNDPTGHFFGLDDLIEVIVIVVIVAISAYMGGAVVNHNMNPAKWNWSSAKTYLGIIVGGVMGGVTLGAAAAAETTMGAVLLGAASGSFESGALTAIGGGSPGQIFEQSFLGGVSGAAFGGIGAAIGRAARGAATAAEAEAGGEGSAFGEVGYQKLVGCSCFTSEVEVKTEEGLKKISEISVGDRVWSYDEEHDEYSYNRVVSTQSRTAESTLMLYTSNGEVIETTPNHPFRIRSKNGEEYWILAGELLAEDKFVNDSGQEIQVKSIEKSNLRKTVYNMTVENAHTYYVSPSNILVHNDNGCPLTRLKLQEFSEDTIMKRISSSKDELQEVLARSGVQRIRRQPVPFGSTRIFEGGEAVYRVGTKTVYRIRLDLPTAHATVADFSEFAIFRVRIVYQGTRTADFAVADTALAKVKGIARPAGYTWEHAPNVVAKGTHYEGDLLLVPTAVHDHVGHYGGVWMYRTLSGGGY